AVYWSYTHGTQSWPLLSRGYPRSGIYTTIWYSNDPLDSAGRCYGRFPTSRRFFGSTVFLAARRWVSLSHPPAIRCTSDSPQESEVFSLGGGSFHFRRFWISLSPPMTTPGTMCNRWRAIHAI